MRHLTRCRSAVLGLVALLIPVGTVYGQRAGQFQISPRIGYVAWDDAAGIQDPVLSSGDCDFPAFGQECAAFTNNLQAGISALYAVANQFAVGLAFDVARPVTNGAYFPAARMEIAGEQELTLVSQRMTIAQAAVEAEFVPLAGAARVSPFLVASLGGYLGYEDGSKSDQSGVTGFDRFGDLMFSFGGGLDLFTGAASGFRIELRDVVYTGWDRNELNPIAPEFQTELFPDLLPAPPDESETIHNIRLSIGFMFLPGGGR